MVFGIAATPASRPCLYFSVFWILGESIGLMGVGAYAFIWSMVTFRDRLWVDFQRYVEPHAFAYVDS